MATTPTDPALADPLFRELRQRHPEVDIVLLPPSAPAPQSRVPSLSLEQRSALADVLDDLVEELLEQLSGETAWTTVERAVERAVQTRTDEWGQSHLEATAIITGLAEGGNIALLRAAGAALLDLGWQARPLTDTPPRLVARRQGFAASATVLRASLAIIVRTPLVRFAIEEA